MPVGRTRERANKKKPAGCARPIFEMGLKKAKKRSAGKVRLLRIEKKERTSLKEKDRKEGHRRYSITPKFRK